MIRAKLGKRLIAAALLTGVAVLSFRAATVIRSPPGRQDPAVARCTTLRGHTCPVHAVAFSPDGQTLASGAGWPFGSGELKLWDVARRPTRDCVTRAIAIAARTDLSLLA